jgi:hypothetical protein
MQSIIADSFDGGCLATDENDCLTFIRVHLCPSGAKQTFLDSLIEYDLCLRAAQTDFLYVIIPVAVLIAD